MIENSGSRFTSRYVRYRKEVEHTKNPEGDFAQKVQKPQTPQTPSVAKTALQPNVETTNIAAQQTLSLKDADAIKSGDLAKAELSPKVLEYMPLIKQEAAKNNLPPELVAGIIYQESRGNAKATSHCGAQGLMQLMPGTAAHLGVSNAYDPAQNIAGGAKYIRQMLDRFDGRLDLAVAAYNAGPGNVEKYKRTIPPFKETQDYVPKVLGYASNFKASGVFIESRTTMRA